VKDDGKSEVDEEPLECGAVDLVKDHGHKDACCQKHGHHGCYGVGEVVSNQQPDAVV